MKKEGDILRLDGELVSMPVRRGRGTRLDGFWRHDARLRKRLLVFVHGMGGNFYRSRLKKELMVRCAGEGFDMLSFDNRGAGEGVRDERFGWCVADIEAALAFGREAGYERFVLAGHSTGCQKIVYYQALRKDPRVAALVLLGPGDDYAIVRRDLGRRYAYWARKARALERAGRGAEALPACCLGFSARRFLSIADPARLESRLLNYAGRLEHVGRIRAPMLVLFGSREEYACATMDEMESALRARVRSRAFDFVVVPGADHGFHGCETETADRLFAWLSRVEPGPAGRTPAVTSS